MVVLARAERDCAADDERRVSDPDGLPELPPADDLRAAVLLLLLLLL